MNRKHNPIRRKAIKSFEQLILLVDEQLQKSLQTNLQELHLSKTQVLALERQKRELKRMFRKCGIGDERAKGYVKQTIREIITEKIALTMEEMESLLPVKAEKKLTSRDRFEIMLACYTRKNQKDALAVWIQEHHLDRKVNKQGVFEITDEDIQNLFDSGRYLLTKQELLDLVVQRVYADYRGLGVVDEIRDMNIDGVSGGVSGTGEEERSVWIMFQGKSIHLAFLAFGSQKELQRICRTIYRYGQPGQLSKARGYVVNEMADHARVVVARPEFCENWIFFVRKLDNLKSKQLGELFQGEHYEVVAFLLEYIVKGCQTIGITGAQGSGKTTLLMSLTEFIPGSFTLRVQESAFELQLRQLYPDRNIVSFRETDSVSGQEGLDFQKKTDGTVSIVGEVASAKQAAWMLQLGQTASLYTMFTHHANSTENLIWALQNNLLQEGQFSHEEIAQQQVVEVVRFHVHLEKNISGQRYIESITEIVPVRNGKKNHQSFIKRQLVKRVKDGYELVQGISEETYRKMQVYYTEKERERYDKQILSCLRKNSMVT